MIDRIPTETLLAERSVAFRSRRDIVTVAGPDAAEYLHGQLSQSVTSLAIRQSSWSLLLSPQGKVDAWLRVTRTGEERFDLDLDEGFGEQALARLARFKLRVAAELSLDTVDWIAVRGPQADQHRPSVDEADPGERFIAELEWDGLTGFDLFGSTLAMPADLEEGDAEAFEALRIQSRIPRLGDELGESTIPAEVGVVDRSADFTKGCYVGQELVARVDSRGNNTPRSMRRIDLAGLDASEGLVGQSLVQDGAEVGTVTSAAAFKDSVVALASVKRAANLDGSFAVVTTTGEQPAVLVTESSSAAS